MEEISLVLNPQTYFIFQYVEKALIKDCLRISLHGQIDKTCSCSENREQLVHNNRVGDRAVYVVWGETWWPWRG